MANTFKNSITGSIGTTNTTVYATPSATSATVIGVSVANVITNNISVSVRLTDTSTSKTVYLVKDALLVPGGSAVLVGGEQKLVMEANDYLSVVSSAASSADVIVSVLEIT
jgi:nucleoside-triphosphatase THEP1